MVEFMIDLIDTLNLVLRFLVIYITPFFWAYIFGRKTKKLKTYFIWAFLLWLGYTIFPNFMEFSSSLLFYDVSFYLLLSSYLVGIICYMQRLKKSLFVRILFAVISTLIFFSAVFFIFIEGEIVSKNSGSDGPFPKMWTLKQAIENYLETHKRYYPTHDEFQKYLTTHQEFPNQLACERLGKDYELTQKKYTVIHNPNLMVAWGKEIYGIILKWRWVIFMGKIDPEIHRVSEGRFQKLLKEQQSETKKYKNHHVRETAVKSLGEIGDPRVKRFISLLKDKDSAVRYTAAKALGEIGDPRAIEPLFAAMKIKGVRDMNLAYAAGEALGKIGTPRAVELLIAVLKDEDSIIRSCAASGLGEAKDPRAVEPLIEALKYGDEYVRWKAALALGEIGDVRAVESLIDAMMKDEDSSVRHWSAWALGKIGNIGAIEPLIAVMRKDEIRSVREFAAEALGEIKGDRAVESLIGVLKNEDLEIQDKAAKALGRTKDYRAIGPLIDALKDGDKGVRISAEYALKEITEKDFGRDPIKWQKWWGQNKGKFQKLLKEQQGFTKRVQK
ncbi:HEAT repeat domain-containing protein [bacterium]|nr:HEAT repeat domain-containing protein [bacterium]MBU1967544.1 HEAT repeat domain-containing protein [Patescibacteria group bacterium]